MVYSSGGLEKPWKFLYMYIGIRAQMYMYLLKFIDNMPQIKM